MKSHYFRVISFLHENREGEREREEEGKGRRGKKRERNARKLEDREMSAFHFYHD